MSAAVLAGTGMAAVAAPPSMAATRSAAGASWASAAWTKAGWLHPTWAGHGLASAAGWRTATTGSGSTLAATSTSSGTGQPVHASSVTHGWIGKQLLANFNLDSISCPSSGVCVAAGGSFANGNSIVERTTNGGVSWAGQTFTSTSTIGGLDDVSCVDASHCLVTGGGTTSTTSTGTAFWTIDGTHWTQSSLPANTPELSSVSCVSDTICITVSFNGGGWYTLDFGKTWTPFTYLTTTSSGGTLVPIGVRYQSVKVGFIFGIDSNCSASSCPTYIERTTSGSNWQFMTTPPGSAVMEGLACTSSSSSDCVATGDSPGGMQAWTSTDDGANWSASAAISVARSSGSVSCPDQNDCYVGGFENPLFTSSGTLADATGIVLHSADAGRTWKLQQTSNGLSSVIGMSCSSALVCTGVATTIQGNSASGSVVTTTDGGVPPGTGYYFVASDGGVFNYGNARFYGSTGGIRLNKPVVGMAVDSTSGGYWLVASDGGIFTFGNAQFFGSTGNIHLVKPIVGMAIDPATGGYWMVASDGGVFNFHAPFYGSMGGKAISAPIVDIVSKADGSGYFLVARDGTVYPFGTAVYEACAGKAPIPQPTVAIAADRVDGGYWGVNAAGQIATCDKAAPHGDLTGVHLSRPVVGMAGTPDGGGYWMVATDGGIFAFGNARFYGSTGNIVLAKPIVAMATVPST